MQAGKGRIATSSQTTVSEMHASMAPPVGTADVYTLASVRQDSQVRVFGMIVFGTAQFIDCAENVIAITYFNNGIQAHYDNTRFCKRKQILLMSGTPDIGNTVGK